MTLTRCQKIEQKGKFKHGHCSTMSNSAWCDLNSKVDILKLHDQCPNNKCNCQKQISFTPKQFQLESNGFNNPMKKIFKGTEEMWENFY